MHTVMKELPPPSVQALRQRPASAEQRRTLALLHSPHRERALELLRHGHSVSLMLFEIQDFTVFTKIYGLDAAETLARAAEKALRELADQSFPGMPFTLLDRLDADRFLLAVGCDREEAQALPRTASILRLGLRSRLKQASLDLTGQEAEVALGVGRLPSGLKRNLENAVHSAVGDAQRMARGGLDASGAMLLTEFRAILEEDSVRSLYQPIVDLRGGDIFAWEALSRGPAGSPFEQPSMLFGFAEENGLVFPLERACRRAALAGFGPRAGGRKLFLNVHPRTLVDPSFNPGETIRLLDELGLAPHDVVLEITERHSTKDFSLFHRTLDHYRGEGYKVAVDDVGTGYSGLWSIAEIRPDFIKLDMSLIRGIDANPVKRALIETFLTFSDKVGCKIVAEGIETASELSSLVSMGVHYGQGYFLARPASPRPEAGREALALIQERRRRGAGDLKCSSPIGLLVEEAPSFPAETRVSDLKRHFDQHPLTVSAAVVSGRRPVGLVTRHLLDRMLSTQYGQALYSNRPVSRIMDGQPLTVDWHTPVELVAQAAMTREGAKVYDHVVVTRDGKLSGLASVQKILDALAQVQMEMAKGASPLTGLPGNVAIERELETRVAGERPVSFVYADLDHFKAYNDAYGFKAGDEVILLTARILSWALRRHGEPGDFIGHVGGDDFVLCTTPERAERVCRAVVRCFGRLAPRCYGEAHRLAGGVPGRDREGREGIIPLVSVSLAVVDCLGRCTPEAVSQRAAEMKKYAKTQEGNVWVRDRRGPLSPCSPER
ncbi:Phytochrome-like protein cph2 [Fundidesulfovibrio magnetotacticus]|uniref:Phytochrome-like protein cph2 n=1 Tax=Fundidesulfovibrio magnetotacticus TaxID=2730080 RepID=A0A6V8M195_9BACT|nr:EAL domain-containing protein [Fundidesulfovibrio magnetotacticus]GFK95726.1 Phytochrome-like protein cph2 [Fundidesulfovibrio magnetotacticus]